MMQAAQPAASTEPSSAAEKGLRDVKVALWGFGNQNKLMAKYLHERKVPIASVISHHDVGKGYTTVDLNPWGKKLGGKPGVKIVGEADAKATLLATQPDICIMCTRSSLQDLYPSLKVCAESKVNVITIAEELMDSRMSSPALTEEIDILFRENGVSLNAVCYEAEMAMELSSYMHRISAVEGLTKYNVNDYGVALAEAHGVGLTPAQFQKDLVENPHEKSYVYNLNDLLVSAFGLARKETTEQREPTFASVPLLAAPLGREIPVGNCTGMRVIATTTTKEGVSIKSEQIGKCYEPNEVDELTWEFQGEPSGLKLTMTDTPSSAMINMATVNRILQVLDAPAGYITSDKLPAMARYKHWT